LSFTSMISQHYFILISFLFFEGFFLFLFSAFLFSCVHFCHYNPTHCLGCRSIQYRSIAPWQVFNTEYGLIYTGKPGCMKAPAIMTVAVATQGFLETVLFVLQGRRGKNSDFCCREHFCVNALTV